MKNKKIFFGILLLGVLLFSFNVQSYFYSSGTQYNSPRTSSVGYMAKQGISLSSGFDENVCKLGQDFVLQVSPLGCSPTIVRSDLLEEQNVPVFCSISATKVNPLIDVNAISSITFSGKYPDSVAGIGYHPAKAALKSSRDTILNSPVLENIGYVVVVLKQNKNESSMPDFVSGNLTATLNYDIQNAFGIGQVTYYLPELSEDEWNTKYDEYSFWQGRGYLRATGIDATGATISIYSDKDHRINSADLSRGESSQETFLPDFYCAAGLQTRLDGLVNPDSRARLNINGEISEVAQGESFLDGACSLSKVEKQGLLQRVDGTCRVDEGSGKFSLLVSPKVRISYNGGENDYIVGDKLNGVSLGAGGRSVYVGYVGKASRGTPYVVLVASPLGSSDEFRVRSPLYSRLPSYMRFAGDPGHGKISKIAGNLINAGINSAVFLAQGDYIIGVKCLGGKRADCDDEKENSNFNLAGAFQNENPTQVLKGITFKGFSQPSDTSLSVSGDPTYYKKAIEDYRRIFTQFPNEQVEGDPTHVAGENALYKGIILSNELMQYQQMLELCNLFEGAYSSSDYSDLLNKICKNDYGMSNSQISAKTVFINGAVKKISLEGIYEPNTEEYGVELTVRKNGQNVGSSPFLLTKNSAVLIDSNEEDTIFEYVGWSGYKLYFQYVNNGWAISRDYASLSNYFGAGYVSGGIVAVSAIAAGGPAGIAALLGGNYLKNSLAESRLKELAVMLSGKNFQQGKGVLLTERATALPNSPISIELSEIKDEENAVINIGVSSLTSVTGAQTSSAQRAMQKGIPLSAGNYEFTVEQINLKRVAKVTVIPNIKKTGTSANFTFHVGIEKRAIQLSPAQIKNKINQLDKNIKQWEALSKNLGAVVEGFKGACLGIGATITIKNFFTNLGGEGIARRQVMTSAGGWNDICKNQVQKGNFSSMDSCLLANNGAIERDVALFAGIISSQQEVTEKNIASSLPSLFSQLPASYQNDLVLKSIFTEKTYENCSSVSLSQARDLTMLTGVLNSGASEESKKISENNMKTTLDSIRATSEGCAARQTFSDNLKIDPSHVGRLPTVMNNILGIPTVINVQELPYYGDTYGGIKNSFAAGTDIVSGNFTSDTPVAFYEDYQGHFLIIILQSGRIAGSYSVLEDSSKIFGIQNIVFVYNGNGGRVTDQGTNNNLKSVSFKKADRSLYVNSIENPEASYFETSPYKGLPAIVPFRGSEGWYVAVRQTLPVGGQIRAYDESGAASSFYICNVGKNRRIDFGSSSMEPDPCEGFNTGVGLKYNSFYGLSEGEVNTLVKDATSVLQQAGQQYPGKNNRISIRTSKGVEEIPVGKPAVDNPEIQCQNFMSAQDCWILFNACDPVICPPSRCNLGGTYPVSNVIQSGIVGSTLLCLPNIKEKIAIPVCLTGVKAGMDGIISLFQNYRDCLQTNLDSGQTIGICDEIHSIYLCEMIWRQTIPFAQMGIPTILEAVMGQGERGGGEYLSVQDAWNTADQSLQYIAQYYGAGSYSAFKVRATEEIGSAICKNSVSATYPSGGDLFDTLLGSDSPSQYYGWFDEIPMTTATIPPTSMYKIFYHVYAGKTEGAYYSVYLKSGESGSYYKNNPVLGIPDATGYIAAGKYASATKEIVAPTGYKDLCINVNGQEQCGFKKATTDFGINYLEEMYVASQADDRDITTETDCVSGTNSLYSLANPNIQEGVDNLINPEVYNHGLIRVCATDNPGKGTDAQWNNPKKQRWKEVGYCDNPQIKCWLDTESVKDTLKSTTLINQSIGEVTNDQLKKMLEEGVKTGEYLDFNDDYKNKLNALSDEQKVSTIDEILIDKAFYTLWKAYLIKLRGDAYFNLSIEAYKKYLSSLPVRSDFSATATPLSSGATGICTTMESAPDQTVIPQTENTLNPVIHAKFFPVQKDSIKSLTDNFGQSRRGGSRCHAGYDIITSGGPGIIIAMDNGVVVNKYTFYKGSYALLVEHTTADGQKYVVNYGEMDASSISKLDKDSVITAGQELGTAKSIGMLHFELYKSGITLNKGWTPSSGKTVGSGKNYCWDNYRSTMKPGLLNPTNTLVYTYNIDIKGNPIYDSPTFPDDEGINPADLASPTGSAILDFGITGNVIGGIATCGDCSANGRECTADICRQISNQLGQDCKFTDSNGQTWKLSYLDGQITQIDPNTGVPLPTNELGTGSVQAGTDDVGVIKGKNSYNGLSSSDKSFVDSATSCTQCGNDDRWYTLGLGRLCNEKLCGAIGFKLGGTAGRCLYSFDTLTRGSCKDYISSPKTQGYSISSIQDCATCGGLISGVAGGIATACSQEKCNSLSRSLANQGQTGCVYLSYGERFSYMINQPLNFVSQSDQCVPRWYLPENSPYYNDNTLLDKWKNLDMPPAQDYIPEEDSLSKTGYSQVFELHQSGINSNFYFKYNFDENKWYLGKSRLVYDDWEVASSSIQKFTLYDSEKNFVNLLSTKDYLEGVGYLLWYVDTCSGIGEGDCSLSTNYNLEYLRNAPATSLEGIGGNANNDFLNSMKKLFIISENGKYSVIFYFDPVITQWRFSYYKDPLLFHPIKENLVQLNNAQTSIGIPSVTPQLALYLTHYSSFEDGAKFLLEFDGTFPPMPLDTSLPPITPTPAGQASSGNFIKSSWTQPAKTVASVKSLEAQKMYAAEIIRIAREIQQKREVTDESVKKDTGVDYFYQLVLNLVYQESAGLRHCRGGKDDDSVYGTAPVAYQNIFTCDGNNEKVMRSYHGGSEVGMFQITSVHDSKLNSLGLDKYKFKDNVEFGINLLIDNYQSSKDWNSALKLYNGGGDVNYVNNVLAHQQQISTIVSGLA